ncbi:hypothetical protein ACC687_38605, partial [Rhizobium ruizarguesonis]
MDVIYNSKILEFAGNIPLTGTLYDADASAQAHSNLCGSKVRILLKMDRDTVTGFAVIDVVHIGFPLQNRCGSAYA